MPDSINDTTYPRTWMFDEDGDTVEGSFLELGEAPTAGYGHKPIVNLDVDGEQRTVWFFHEALASKFNRELERRQALDFNPGERIRITRLGRRESETSGRKYVDYAVQFLDAPKRSAADILGAVVSETAGEEGGDKPEDDDDIPFS
jgi:hypothetical protein